MLRKFQAFRSIYQFQVARIANDPRNQDGYGKNIGEKLQDAAKNTWDSAKEKLNQEQKRDFDLNKGSFSSQSSSDKSFSGSGSSFTGSSSGQDSNKQQSSTSSQSSGMSNMRGGGGVSYGGTSSGSHNYSDSQQKFDQAGIPSKSDPLPNNDLQKGTQSFGKGAYSPNAGFTSEKDMSQRSGSSQFSGTSDRRDSQTMDYGGSQSRGQMGTGSFSQSSNKDMNQRSDTNTSFGKGQDDLKYSNQQTDQSSFGQGSSSEGQNQKSYEGGSHFDQTQGRDDLRAGSGGSGMNWQGSSTSQNINKDYQNISKAQDKSFSQSGQNLNQNQNWSNKDQNINQRGQSGFQQSSGSGQGQHNMAQDVTEKVKEYAGKITETVVDGYHKVEEKLKDMTGMGKHDQNKK